MRLQFLIPVASIISSCLTLSIVWWAWQRRKEREAYYRYELSRLMLERLEHAPERFSAWLQEQEAGDDRRRRETLRLTAWVLVLGGAAALIGVGFTSSDESLFGWVPIGVGAGITSYLVASRKRATV